MGVTSFRAPPPASGPPVAVDRWPSELPLQALCMLFSVVLYVLLAVSIVGLVYVVAAALFFFGAQAAFVAWIRGNAVRLGPDQFPDLYRRVLDLAGRIGLDEVPDAYLMQAGGALNAFATRFLGLHLIVLYSELLEACGDNAAARDMIIAHELGHVKAGHLKLRWLIAPANLMPFLGTALSRAREYTCDRYGVAGAGDRDGALLGLTVLAAGGRRAPAVNRRALARQREDTDTGWLTIGEWLAGHPTLARRLAAIEPALVEGTAEPLGGRIRALAIIGAFVLVVVVGGGMLIRGALTRFMEEAQRAAAQRQQQSLPYGTEGTGQR